MTTIETGKFTVHRQCPRVEVQIPVEVLAMDTCGQPCTNPALVTNMPTGEVWSQGVARRGRVGELFDIGMSSETGQFRGAGS